ncbi:MAG: SDR family NAD(P)-dependent oxidoreductase [Gemmobacter sp.]
MNGLEGRVALVTGCGSAEGIGFAIARALVAAGCRVAITATTARIHDRRDELGAAFAGTADLTDPAQVARLFAEVRAALGPVEVLVNNAGMVQTGRSIRRSGVDGLTDAGFAAHLAMNVGTAFHGIRAALPDMRDACWGRIVNISSITGPITAISGSSGYATAKAAVTGLTRATALENAAFGITCNAVLPGWITTGSSSPKEVRAGRASPTRRSGTPDEVAACALFLASEGASYVNGAMLVVDGANSLVEIKGAGAF